ncbi:acyl-CoA dehydrogenase family protein [Noviherbaspirillum sedimenti]|nr:acyl-CoA dehydrogenase family protein [Noviherbaspirillum sedimenti]
MFNFGLNDYQIALKESVQRYLHSECDLHTIRKIIESSDCFSEKVWNDLANLGLLGMNVPEEFGGSGLGSVDLAVVMECLGSIPLPGPYLETITVADMLVKAGTDEQRKMYLPKIAAGQLVATYAIDEPDGYWCADAVQATAVHSGDDYSLNGRKLWVPYANVADLIICAVRTSQNLNSEEGISLIVFDRQQLDIPVMPLNSMDESYRLCEINLDGLRVPSANILGKIDQGWPIWKEGKGLATLLASAEMIGGIDKSLQMAVSYSRERVQFGKPIGSYQAIKHRCADMLTDLEAVRGSVYYAAWAMQNQLPDAEIAISSAKAYASDAYVRTAEKSLQIFGAIGFTWEHDIHFYLKRAKRLEMAFGDATFHRENVAENWLGPSC